MKKNEKTVGNRHAVRVEKGVCVIFSCISSCLMSNITPAPVKLASGYVTAAICVTVCCSLCDLLWLDMIRHPPVSVWDVDFQGQISDSRPVNWGWLAQLGTKAVSSVGKQLILGLVVKIMVRLWLG